MYSNHDCVKEKNIATPHLSYAMIMLSYPNYPQIIPHFANDLQPVILLSFNFDTVQKLLEFPFENLKYDKCNSTFRVHILLSTKFSAY
jgi:hypothetical protein